ncbi:unnamed protein product [Thelazia callipaeda]|uniref:Neur_chan_LBD domain-containing protein n=1 Tax=Thelazia callipaeda TaxID=103827 RepID=A0A0N5CUN7_THECL|nr:unnamed protein product [Thelazia callipaeda]
MQYFNTEVTLISNGAVYAQVILTVRSTCSLDFSAYPNDIQSCLLTMFTPLPMSRLRFSRWTSLTRKSSIFGSLMDEKRIIRSGEFEVTNLSATPLFILRFGKITVNESADQPDLMRSIIRFEIKFRRVGYYYLMTVALPLFCLATATYIVGTVASDSNSIVWLMLCLVVQIMNYTQMLNRLPPNQHSIPLCAKMATLIMLETSALILYRAVTTFCHNCSTEKAEILKYWSTSKVEKALRILLLFHTGVNGILLFY